MKKTKFPVIILLLLALHYQAFSQNNRLKTNNTIGWYAYFGTFKLSNKVGLHTEYQLRRVDVVGNEQQGLLRVGINYSASPRLLLRIGYANAETYAYGQYPINGLGKAFTEHRAYQMAQLSHKEGIVDLSHRFMLEQRFVGRYTAANLDKEDQYPFMNRMRYMFRMQIPLKGREMKDKTPYVAAYEEILIGFGKNVTANVFDQNRLGLSVGYRFDKNFRLEAGYLNQTLQFGRLIDGRNVFQHNNGLVINANFNFDMSHTK